MSMGRQPPNMLTPSRFCRSMISRCISCLRGSVALYLAYLALMTSICGWMRCIFSDDFIIWKRVGSMATLRMTVSRRMHHPQLGTMCS